MTAVALGYTSVPVDLELEGPEAEAQRLAIEETCEQLDLRLAELVREHQPGSPEGDGQPGLLRALDRIDSGEASCLVVTELEHLGRRVRPLAAVLDRLEQVGARLVALNVGLDTATDSGRLAVTRRPSAPVPPDAPPTEPIPRAGTAVRALGYASVAGDADGGLSELHAQQQTIESRCRELGVELIEVVREREPKAGKALDRAGLSFLIERVAAGDASCLVVTGLERLSHSVAELGTILQWLEQNGVRLVAVDLDLDTASPGGQTTARVLASVAGWEHERISERTRKGLAAARAQRRAAGGSATDVAAVRRRIATMRADGMTLQAIADVLNDEGVPTLRGGAKWRPSSVQSAAGYKRRSGPRKVGDLPTVDKDRKAP